MAAGATKEEFTFFIYAKKYLCFKINCFLNYSGAFSVGHFKNRLSVFEGKPIIVEIYESGPWQYCLFNSCFFEYLWAI